MSRNQTQLERLAVIENSLNKALKDLENVNDELAKLKAKFTFVAGASFVIGVLFSMFGQRFTALFTTNEVK